MVIIQCSVIVFAVFIIDVVNSHASIIIVEDAKACFRRVLAGKRVTRRCVRRSLLCERAEDCQRECAEEKYFFCEGFNYRLDPTGRGKGECELLDTPLSRLDLVRDLVPDPDYDYYERDRNAASVNCRQRPSGYYPPSGGQQYLPSRYPSGSGGGNRRHYDTDDDYYYYDDKPSGSGGSGKRRPSYDYDKRYYDKPYYDDYGPSGDGNRRGDFSYHHTHHSQQNYENSHSYHYHYTDRNDYHQEHDTGHHYPGFPSNHYSPGANRRPFYDYKSYDPYLPPRRHDDKYFLDREKDRGYWGLNNNGWGSYGGSYGNFGYNDNFYHNRNRHDYDRDHDSKIYYLPPKVDGPPPKVGGPKFWGQYGGVYGTSYGDYGYKGHKHGYVQSLDYWNGDKPDYSNDLLPPRRQPHHDGSYLPPSSKPDPYPDFHHSHSQSFNHYINSILPAEPRIPTSSYLKDECSLRSATGFKLHRGIVKKSYAVPNIYECELLCYKEKDFPCNSYAFRYSLSLSSPSPNCYLSNKNYKELDFYTDVEPDKDFDIYTMNNYGSCEQPMDKKDDSDCFWRVRSGQRLEQKVVRDSLSVKSIVDCQIECLESRRFTCRAFSFRYGSPTIGGAIDNCQLTDWPYYELDPRLHFVPETGFEVYERGSFGHGCEPDHFGIRGKPISETQVDQLCYVGLGLPARLLPQATRKALRVESELDCKAECSKAREGTLFQCMSFSYRTNGHDSLPNCFLSDILQRDLLNSVDYVEDSYSWLFAWDNYNPQCVVLANEPIHRNQIDHHHDHDHDNGRINHDVLYPMDTWKVYSVSGWPCRRGSLCKQNRAAGFWYCELEFGDTNSWDYCCRPDHQCGYTQSFPYQWCYVGPERTQWRKCSDRYYPYSHHSIDRNDFDGYPHSAKPSKPFPPPDRPPNRYIPPSPGDGYPYPAKPSKPFPPPKRPPNRYIPPLSGDGYPYPTHPSKPFPLPERPPNRYLPPASSASHLKPPPYRPDRPSALPLLPPTTPSLDDYEMQFDNQFLEPPKPGGFGQPRHWPVSYLHKEMPPNNTDSKAKSLRMKEESSQKYEAIKNLINVIKSNDLNNIQYQITNESNKQDDILFVKIPLPANFTEEAKIKSSATLANSTNINLEPVDIDVRTAKNNTKRSSKLILPSNTAISPSDNSNYKIPVYRRGFVTRTNVSSHGRNSRNFS